MESMTSEQLPTKECPMCKGTMHNARENTRPNSSFDPLTYTIYTVTKAEGKEHLFIDLYVCESCNVALMYKRKIVREQSGV